MGWRVLAGEGLVIDLLYPLLVFVLVGALVWRVFQRDPASRAELALALSHHPVLIDVRTPTEFRESSLPGAVNLPVDQLAGRVSELDLSRPWVVYCASGRRSAYAVRLLRQSGCARVVDGGAKDNLARLLPAGA